MKIDNRHHAAAKAMASGQTDAAAADAAGVHVSSVNRWKRDTEFQELITFYTAPAERVQAKAIASGEDVSYCEVYRLIPERERELVQRLETMLDKLADVLVNRLETLSEDEIAELPTRLLAQMMKTYFDGLGVLQQTHDRASGYEMVLNDLERIHAAQPSSNSKS